MNQLIEQFFSTFEAFDFNLEETALYLQKINKVILVRKIRGKKNDYTYYDLQSLANRAYNYEEKYLPLYEISHHFGDLWMSKKTNHFGLYHSYPPLSFFLKKKNSSECQ